MVHIPAVERPVALESGVQDAAQILIAVGSLLGPEQRVGLIDQHGGRVVFVQGAHQRRDRGVDGQQWAVRQLIDQVEQAALA
jgi:hypothetical protein